jgi:hypothetical protein
MATQTDPGSEIDQILGITGLGQDPSRMGPPRSWRMILPTALLAIALIGVGTWTTYWADLRNDQYQLINLGRCVCDGGRLYVDCWENKPPGIAWINALGLTLSGGRLIGAWLMPGLVGLLCLAVVGPALGRVLSTLSACAAVLLASAVYSLRLYDTPSVNPDFYSSMLELAACAGWLLCLRAATAGRRWGWGLGAGILWAAAFMFKQTGLVGLAAVTLVTVAQAPFRHDDRRRWLTAGACTWIGFALGLAAVIGVLVLRQALTPAWEAVVGFNRGLMSWEAVAGAAQSWSRGWQGLAPIQLVLWLLFLGGVVTLRLGRAGDVSRWFIGAMLLWWVAQALLALAGPSRSMRYWQATFPPALMLAGVGVYCVEQLFRGLRRDLRTTCAILVVSLALVLAKPLAEHYVHGLASSHLAYASRDREDTQRRRLEAVGRSLQEVVPVDKPVYVWAYDAGIYLYAGRPSACRFTYPRSADQMEEILASLTEDKAYAILLPEGGAPEFERWCDRACYRRLDHVLSGYRRGDSIGGYRFWIRR